MQFVPYCGPESVELWVCTLIGIKVLVSVATGSSSSFLDLLKLLLIREALLRFAGNAAIIAPVIITVVRLLGMALHGHFLLATCRSQRASRTCEPSWLPCLRSFRPSNLICSLIAHRFALYICSLFVLISFNYLKFKFKL